MEIKLGFFNNIFHLQTTFHEFVYLHYRGLVTTSVAIVGSGEDSHDITLVSPVVSIHDKLMSTCDSHQVIGVIELFGDVLAERVASTSWRDTPTTSVIRVRPEEITDGTLVRSLLNAIELADLIKCIDRGGETTVEAENLILNDGSERKVVKEFSESLPDISITIFTEAFIIETVSNKIERNINKNCNTFNELRVHNNSSKSLIKWIIVRIYCSKCSGCLYLHLSDLSALVISSKDGDSISKTHLKGNKEGHSLHRVVATIDVISHEEIVSVGRAATDLEELAQVVELTVDITTNCYRGTNFLHIRFVNQNFFGLYSK